MKLDRERKTITISQNTGITVSVMLMIMFTGAVATATTWVATTENRVSAVEERSSSNKNDINKLKTENTNALVKFTEIQSQLKSMDITLTEIKSKL